MSQYLYEMIERNKMIFLYVVTSMIACYFIFSPSLNLLYYVGDDYRYTFGNPGLACTRDDGYFFMMTLGRPLQAYQDCLSFRYAYNLYHMRDIRILTILLMGAGIGLIADWLSRMGVTKVQAILIAGSMLMVPHFYGDALLMGAFSLSIAILASIVGVRLVVMSHGYSKWISRLLVLLAGFILILGLLSYPAMMFFYPVLVLTKLLFTDLRQWQRTRGEVIKESLVFAAACIIYFAYAYFNMRNHSRSFVPPHYQLTHPNFHPIEMMQRLWMLVNVYDPAVWGILPLSEMGRQGMTMIGLVFSGMAASLFYYLRYMRRTVAPSAVFQAVVLAAGLIVVSCGMSLLMPIMDFGHRLLLGTVSAGIILTIWGLFQVAKIIPLQLRDIAITLTLSFVVLLQAYQSNIYMMRASASYTVYLNKHTAAIQDFRTNSSLKRIHFVVDKDDQPYTRYLISSGALTAVFGHDNYKVEWCGPSRVPADAAKYTQKYANKCVKQLPADTIGVTTSFAGEQYQAAKDTLVIKSKFSEINLDSMVTPN